MEEAAAVHMEFLAAEIVVGAQKKVVSEDAVFLASQAPLGDPEEVREVLFPFAGEDAAAGGTVAGLPGDGGGALAESEARYRNLFITMSEGFACMN